LAGFAAVAFTSYNTYSKIIDDDIVNISKLTSTNIYSDIRNELTKPIFVSLTMANDSFLKDWLRNERTDRTASHQEELRQYLLGLKKKYDYDSVFLVSDNTDKYYHFNGLNKVISQNDDHDVWYYTFIDGGHVYDLDVDTDEANKGHLSVFVNCRMTDDDGKLMGVTGVGVEMDQVQSLLRTFEDEYDLEALLFDENGTVQISTRLNDIGLKNVFDADILRQNKQKIVENRDSLQIFQFKEQSFYGYYIVRYVEELNWYLLIKKDTSVLARSMYAQTVRDAVIYGVVVLFVLFITNGIVRKNDQLMRSLLRTDSLTGLPNRRSFNETLAKAISTPPGKDVLYVFVFDLDNFKNVNDTHGHLTGDRMLQVIGRLATDAFQQKGLVCRWGGDEFAGYCFCNSQEVNRLLENFFSMVRNDTSIQQYHTSVSLGITQAHEHDNPDTLIYRADQALYDAKGSGKDHWVLICEDPA
jgi:diguanylate cyclase (GGDEF)-like protein